MDKVLILTTIGGFLPQFEMGSVQILRKMGLEVHYASNFNNPVYELDKDKLREAGIRLHQVDIQKSPFRLVRNLRALFQTLRIINREGIQFYHFHNPVGGVLGRVAALIAGKAKYIVYTAHGFHFYKGAPKLNWLLFYPVEYLLAKRTNCMITINEEDYLRAGRFQRKKSTHVVRIPGVGVDIEKFSPQAGRREQMRKRLGIAEDTFYILSVGELNANKNHQVILRAMVAMNDSRIHYGICGAGPGKPWLEKLAARLGLQKQFTLFGYMRNIPEMLQCADCFAFPSKREGLGIAAIEAMAAGIPLITSDCRGTREYMEDGVTGLVCFSGSPGEYATKIRKMIEAPEIRRGMSAACRKKAADFDKEKTYRIIREVYRKFTEDQ